MAWKLSANITEVNDLIADTLVLQEQLIEIMELHSDPLPVFTAMPLMANTMNP